MNTHATPRAISCCLLKKTIMRVIVFSILTAFLAFPLFSSSASLSKKSIDRAQTGGAQTLESTLRHFRVSGPDLGGNQFLAETTGSTVPPFLALPQAEFIPESV